MKDRCPVTVLKDILMNTRESNDVFSGLDLVVAVFSTPNGHCLLTRWFLICLMSLFPFRG